ncbi:hypothetical protein SUDANB121_05017 [Nocardiopsis dassonvillei]|uniref:hypothetical protein n=1 Tax=Nocardiopsis dassonvillei TaxID=2014 RepID=UPI003F55650F
MGVAAVMSTLGLAALVALPGIQAPDPPETRELVPGAETLHVTLTGRAEPERLAPGDRVRYTIGVRNSGPGPVPAAEVVHILPPTMRYVTGTEGAEVDGGRVVWTRPLEAGERATFDVTGELTALPAGSGRPVSTVCLRSGADGVLASCASQEHAVLRPAVPLWAAATAALAVLLALAGGGTALYLRTRGTRPAPPEPSNHTPGSVPNIRTFPGATVHHLDAHR